MKRSNPKSSFNPGFFVTKKILALAVLFCFVVFFSLVFAGEPGTPNNPLGEHPWDDLKSQPDHQPTQPPGTGEVIIFPSGGHGGWIIIHLPQVKDGDSEKDRVRVHSTDKNRSQFFMFF
jgi:hypothetical protein